MSAARFVDEKTGSLAKTERVLAMPIVGVGFDVSMGTGEEPPEMAPATERVTRPSVKMRPATSVAPSISLDAAAPATREEMTALLAALGASHAKLDLDLAYVDKLASVVFDRDAVSRAAAETVMLRSLEVAELRDALGRVVCAVDDPQVEALLAPGATLSSYVKVLYLWCGRIVGALIDFAASALRGNPAWVQFEMRIGEMAQFQVHALTEQIRHEAGAYGIFSEFGERLDELFWAAWYLHESMRKGDDSRSVR